MADDSERPIPVTKSDNYSASSDDYRMIQLLRTAFPEDVLRTPA